jgi:hypothetical protein
MVMNSRPSASRMSLGEGGGYKNMHEYDEDVPKQSSNTDSLYNEDAMHNYY